MSRSVRMLILTVALLGSAPAAQAATPFTAGIGADPSVAVGADGSGHAVWATTEDDSQVGYCRLTAGAESCNRTELLNFPGATAANSTGRPVVFTPAANKVVIVAGCWNCGAGGITDRSFLWTSLNNGESFGAPTEIGSGFEHHGTGLWLDDVGMFVGVSSSRAKAATAGGTGIEYATGGVFVYGPEIVRVPGSTKLVAATNDLDVVKYGVFTGPVLDAPGVNNLLNWETDRTLPAPEGDNSDTDLTSGPNGVYLTYRYFVPNDNRVGLRRFDPVTDTFGGASYIEGPDGIDNNSLDYPDSFQDPSGRIHVVWRTLYDGQRLRYTVSDGSGASFTPVANLAKQESFNDPALAAGADGKGFAVWTNGTTGPIRIVPLDPQPEPITTPPPGGGGTTPPPGGTTGPTAVPTFSFSGPGNGATAVIIGDRVRVRMRGTIRPPAGVSVSSACKGRVRLILKKKRKTLARTRARLKIRSGRCRFGKTIFIARRRAGAGTRLRLKVRFRGNAVLRAGQTSKTLIVRS